MVPFALPGRRALVVGIANDQSIAFGVARALRAAGADLAVTWLNAKAEPHVRPLAADLGAAIAMPLDVAAPAEEDALFAAIEERWGGLDILVHSVAFAPGQDLHGRLVDSSPAGFATAVDVSVHSFLRLARRAEPMMPPGSACLTMSFYGARRVVAHYNLMGPVKAALEASVRALAVEFGPRDVTVNAISPGTIATRAAGGIDRFDEMMAAAAARAPLGRLATIDDVGAAAVFLCSPGARAITGTTLHVDAGFHVTA